MSSNEQTPDDPAETSDVGGLGEVVPEPLMPIWRRIQLVQEFRETHGDTYVTVLEALTAIALTAGYVFWLYLYFVSGTGVPL